MKICPKCGNNHWSRENICANCYSQLVSLDEYNGIQSFKQNVKEQSENTRYLGWCDNCGNKFSNTKTICNFCNTALMSNQGNCLRKAVLKRGNIKNALTIQELRKSGLTETEVKEYFFIIEDFKKKINDYIDSKNTNSLNRATDALIKIYDRFDILCPPYCITIEFNNILKINIWNDLYLYKNISNSDLSEESLDFRDFIEKFLWARINKVFQPSTKEIEGESLRAKKERKAKAKKSKELTKNDIFIESHKETDENVTFQYDNILYIHKSNNIKCYTQNHEIVSVTAVLKGRRAGDVDLNVTYCKKCDKYLISYSEFMSYRDLYGIMIGNFRMDDENSGYTGEVLRASESPLMLCGYNVRDGVLTDSERLYILSEIIKNTIMSKSEIIKYLQSFIQINGKKKGNERAVEKWESDLNFVRNFGMETQERVDISEIKRY